MNIDFDLVMYDFVATFREVDGNEKEIDKGVQTFIHLVLDKLACRARMAFLHALDAAEETPDEISVVEHLGQCIDHISRLGIEGALAKGDVTLEDLADLSNHPNSLWQLHCAICPSVHNLAVENESGGGARCD